ncbi:glycerol uptake facilitator protein [Spiroplasma chinense]|uniref:Glycerol uptake facilitator protein n=1 Tax=Spiroplasma chinense TaxID=216932 RepID=A0A5B9Y525_9MOLU|nr:MIP/aquaporin family protein [Spiroplasma chinense]QEH61357.1 glycerol uptake facilitator protein [Spiroplasma chinense]
MDNWLTYFSTELLGTMILIVLGNGVVANIVLKGTKGNNSGWIAISAGWGFAVTVGATISSALGGVAHLNPAVTIAMLISGWKQNIGPFSALPLILLGQVCGAIIGQIIVDIFYVKHINDTLSSDEKNNVLAMHATIPTHRNAFVNVFCEFIATAVLIATIMATRNWFGQSDWMGPIIVGVCVIAIGLSLGGTTGYAINPVRDLIPRIVHQLLPIKGKGKSDWKYSWIPVVGPILAGLVIGAAFI